MITDKLYENFIKIFIYTCLHIHVYVIKIDIMTHYDNIIYLSTMSYNIIVISREQ